MSTSQPSGEPPESSAPPSSERPSSQRPAEPADEREDEGPGCLPGLMAAGTLAGIFVMVACGVSSWVLFQKRTELAARTLRGSVIPTVQQSHLAPADKEAILAQLEQVAEEAEQGRLENWQAAGIMQRLVRLPILQWGDLEAIEQWIEEREDWTEEEREAGALQFSRLRRAVEVGQATSYDFDRVLAPVSIDTGPDARRRLDRQADDERLRDVIERARLVADRAEVPPRHFESQLPDIVRRQIELGRREGTM